MNDKKKARGTHGEFPLDDDMCLSGGAVSSADCTGLVPEGSVDSADEYTESNMLHRYGAQRNDRRK